MNSKPKIHLVLMLIKWGALVVDGRGKLGGHVAAANKAGSYLRTKVTPVNPQSTAQTSVRALFGSISQAWAGLGSSTISAWNSAVAEWSQTNIFGDLKQPSGKALYQRLNNQAQIVGYSAISSPPAKLPMVQGIVTDIEIDLTGDTILATGVYAGADAKVVLFSSGVVSDGTSFVKGKMRQLYFATANVYDGGDAYDAYVAKFGAPLVGDRIFLGIKYVLPNGQASPLLTQLATVTP